MVVTQKKRGVLKRLDTVEVVIGDGGFLYCMERRGYVKAGAWTPEATVEHPEAVRQLHSEFLRAGADVMQTFTFYASKDKLENRSHSAGQIGYEAINQSACVLARDVASKGDALVAGNISQVPDYLSGPGKELFWYVEQAEWATEMIKATGKPVVVCLSISLTGDMTGILPGECADVQKYAREAYDMGIRYIGACRGYEPYRVRVIAEVFYSVCLTFNVTFFKLAKGRGKLPPASEKHGLWGDALRQHTHPWVRVR
ncbi:hypothetical protein pdam_00015005 [Pocillopora damicornis]|uniref:Hcy-binding domain-containing protein n=1 Tax=Pocillopora damicornis TaxID=46731 RepID=A0A3M6T5F3_POCDA|nr:hypothetical protein pdam_00015005 [Pocillopora damicornis]